MKLGSGFAAASLGCVLALVLVAQAESAELKVISSIGFQTILEDVGPRFEQATGHKLTITFDSSGGAVKRVQNGEVADILIIPRRSIEGLVKEGKADADSATNIATSGIGVAVRKGAAKPDISSPEALKRALIAAKSITYSNPAAGGASGIHFAKVLDRLGIAEEMKPKTVFRVTLGPVADLVVSGEAEIAVQQLPELMHVAGVEVVGPLPGDLQDSILFAAAVMPAAKDAVAAKALVNFLRTQETAAVIKVKGMEPVAP
jgi:molybdate transport system substrate-binding protein